MAAAATMLLLGSTVMGDHVDSDDHAHMGDDDSMSNMTDTYLRVVCNEDSTFELHIGCDADCGNCMDDRTGLSETDCAEETHDGEPMFVQVNCTGHGHANVMVYYGDDISGCDDENAMLDVQMVEAGVCTMDQHGHDNHVMMTTAADGAAQLPYLAAATVALLVSVAV